MGLTPGASAGAYEAVWRRKGGAWTAADIPAGTRLDVGARFAGTGDRLLDVGCGNGTLGRLVAGRFRVVAGVEFTAAGADAARAAGVRVTRADLNGALPVRAAAFDVVTCLDVIEHVLDPRALLREIGRVLRPGGRAVVSTPNIQFWRHIWSIARGRFPRTSTDPEGYDGGHLHYFTFRDLETLAREAGLEIVHRHGIINAPAYGLKNRLLCVLAGERFVREFRTFGVLLVLRRPAAAAAGAPSGSDRRCG
jgi:methionine biosynthesis protein MetW